MSTEMQVESTTQAPLASELSKTAELLRPEHKAAKLLAPEKRKKVKAKTKVKTAKAKTAKKAVKAKTAKRKPVSGQSGPSIDGLAFDDLNKKEKLVLGQFELKGEREVRTIEALAGSAFRNQSAKKANSWARNSLRRLIRANWLEKTEPGMYRLSESGRKRLVRADAA